MQFRRLPEVRFWFSVLVSFFNAHRIALVESECYARPPFQLSFASCFENHLSMFSRFCTCYTLPILSLENNPPPPLCLLATPPTPSPPLIRSHLLFGKPRFTFLIPCLRWLHRPPSPPFPPLRILPRKPHLSLVFALLLCFFMCSSW